MKVKETKEEIIPTVQLQTRTVRNKKALEGESHVY